MDSNLKGNIGEAAAILHFTKEGYEIYTPLGTASKCDMVIMKDGEVLRVSVKTTSTKSKNGKKWDVRIRQGKLNNQIPFDKTSSDLLFIYILPEDRNIILKSKDVKSGYTITI